MFPSMNSRPNFTSQNVTKHPAKLSTLVPIFPILFCYPHFSIRIFPSAFYHPHFSIRIFPSAFFHPHFSIRIFPSAFFHPPSAIRRHPVLTLQRPEISPRNLQSTLSVSHCALKNIFGCLFFFLKLLKQNAEDNKGNDR